MKREKDEGRKEVYTVYTVRQYAFPLQDIAHKQLALVAWKVNFFKFLGSEKNVSRLTQAILKQIEAQRNGEVVDTGLLKQVIASYGA